MNANFTIFIRKTRLSVELLKSLVFCLSIYLKTHYLGVGLDLWVCECLCMNAQYETVLTIWTELIFGKLAYL